MSRRVLVPDSQFSRVENKNIFSVSSRIVGQLVLNENDQESNILKGARLEGDDIPSFASSLKFGRSGNDAD